MIPSHERNVLVWLVARSSRLWLAAILAALVVIIDCGLGSGPTTPERPQHPNEVKVEEFSHCHARYYAQTQPGFSVRVEITETRRMVPCPGGECMAKGWAMLPGNQIVYWGPYVRGEYEPLEAWSLEMIAAHEVAHVYYMTTDESKADFAAAVAYNEAGCHESM